jgi:hypothetical protein
LTASFFVKPAPSVILNSIVFAAFLRPEGTRQVTISLRESRGWRCPATPVSPRRSNQELRTASVL